MLTDLSPDDVLRYRRDGFLVADRFLDPGELEEWREATAEAVDDRGWWTGSHAERLDDADERERWRQYQKVFKQVQNLWRSSARMKRLLVDKDLGRMAAELAGVDGLRIWHDQALLKPPFGMPTDFHLDVPYWSFSRPDAISVWLALDDATIGNGCLWYVPGSHLSEDYTRVEVAGGLGSLFEATDRFGTPEPVPAPVPAGGAVFHNGLIVHGAGANMTPRWRRAMTCAFMPDGATYNGHPHWVLGKEYLEKLQVGEILDDDDVLPLVYRT